MIDLALTRAGLLAEIGAPAAPMPPLEDPLDPRIRAPHACLRVRGHTQNELFALLEVVLSRRFGAAERARCLADLLAPLRSALGNAFKHGNGGEPTRWITVEAFLSPTGAVVAVSDQGAGFDVAAALRRLRAGERYFTSEGAGLRRLDRARSLVTYEEGGRTLLLRFLGASEKEGSAPRLPEGEWLRRELSAHAPDLAPWLAEPGSLEVHPAFGRSGPGGQDRDLRHDRDLLPGRDGADRRDSGGDHEALDLRCVLRPGAAGMGEPGLRILTARLHPDATAAAADFEAASRLYQALRPKRVWIPRPLARPATEPRLVVYDFHPWMSFGEYLAERDDAELARRRCGRMGRALASLHGSRIVFATTASELAAERFRS
ncbi:MAG TPA: ATP-binding protein, partial [Thermoanaerobaculia bacterium]|nr:ATP-binding protein [Thermoanaerobaculia bacterium]